LSGGVELGGSVSVDELNAMSGRAGASAFLRNFARAALISSSVSSTSTSRSFKESRQSVDLFAKRLRRLLEGDSVGAANSSDGVSSGAAAALARP
jgi:hypothetical protein